MKIKNKKTYSIKLSNAEYYTLLEALKKSLNEYHTSCIAYGETKELIKQLEDSK